MSDKKTKKSELQIIGAGCGRTGTSSLQEALQILGFGKCYHMREVFKDPNGLSKWEEISNLLESSGNSPSQIPSDIWDDIFGNDYKSTADFPAALYYKELLAKFPNAKVILTVRDEEKWATSVKETVMPASTLWYCLYRLAGLENVRFTRMVQNVCWIPFVGSRSNARNRQKLIEGFRKHNQEVKEHVPSEQLLVFEVKEGWPKLCKFLNVPIPKDQPFPRLNDTPQFQKMIQAKRQKTIKRLLLIGATVTVGVGVGVGVGVSIWLGCFKSSSGSSNRKSMVPRSISAYYY